MQHLASGPEGKSGFPLMQPAFKPGYGSSRIIELNHMFLRLCGPPSIPLSFIVADVLPRWLTFTFARPRTVCRPGPVSIVYGVDYQGI